MDSKIYALSLFANVGIAEVYLKDSNIKVKVANEIDEKRAKFYKKIYPDVNVVTGDITNEKVKDEIVIQSIKEKIDLVIATPPCQGMSTAGKKNNEDPRNRLICEAVEIIKKIKPRYVFIENVPEQLVTKIHFQGNEVFIPDYLEQELGEFYFFNSNRLVNCANYGIGQSRERAIFLLTSKRNKCIWELPEKDKVIRTLFDEIGHLPILDPLIYDIPYGKHLEIFPDYERRMHESREISKWHIPPKHVCRQVYSMMHTPTGKSAFDNIDLFQPKKEDGSNVKGYRNTYKRQEWHKPAFTITMFNRTIGSQNNVHPGRYIGKDKNGYDLYSDPRVLTIYEIMKVTSLPDDWYIPEGFSEHFIRSVIGEGIPPLLVKKIMEKLPYEA